MQNNYYAPDGYRYGVMFNDGSVTDQWNGSTQRERAAAYVLRILGRQVLSNRRLDYISVCRRKKDGEWERMRL